MPEIYRTLREEHGDVVTYADDANAHMVTEFRFDVLQVARTARAPDLVTHALAFEVAKPLLDRAFRETYALGLDDVFASTDVAVTTYRWAFREAMHELTGIAWELYRADIRTLDPEATPAGFIVDVSRGDFERHFGDAYARSGYFARTVAFLAGLVPNVGPLRRLPYRPLPEDAQRRFARALDEAVARYERAVRQAGGGRRALPKETLDTGEPTRPGAYAPADEAHAALLGRLAQRGFAGVSPALRAYLLRFWADGRALAAVGDADERAEIESRLAGLDAAVN